jgi:hypothetical protein
MEEVWKEVVGYEGHYQVSDTGNVVSTKFGKSKPLKPYKTSKGYLRCLLSKDGIKKNYKVHQLVAMSFLNHAPCGMKAVIDHINDDKLDNRPENLRVVSNRENCHTVKAGTCSSHFKGVHWDKNKNKWKAQAYLDKKKVHLGYFSDEEMASERYESFITLTPSRI